MSKVKMICSNNNCSFKPVKFNTFEYMYCSSCKSEVDEELVEYKARQKAYKDTKKPKEEDDQMDLFDFWSTNI